MKKTKLLVATLALTLACAPIPAFAALPANSIIIGDKGYSSEYVSEYSNEINDKISSTKDPIYFVDQNQKITTLFGNDEVSEAAIAQKTNGKINYYFPGVIQIYTAKDSNSAFQKDKEYKMDENSAEADLSVKGTTLKTITLKIRSISGMYEGKYFKLENSASKAINGKDIATLVTSKPSVRVYIIGTDGKTRLAYADIDLSSAQSGTNILKLEPSASGTIDADNAKVTNNPGRGDQIQISNLQPKQTIKVYDGSDTTKVLGKAIATSSTVIIKNLNLNPSGGTVKVSLSDPDTPEGDMVAVSYDAENISPLYSKATFIDPTGFENNNKLQVRLGNPSVKGNTFVYKVSDSAITAPKFNDVFTIGTDASSWRPIISNDIISISSQQHLALAEVERISDTAYRFIRFSDAVVTVKNDLISPLQNGLKFADVPGIDNNDQTEILLGNPSAVGNRFVYKLSSSNAPVTAPSYGTVLDLWSDTNPNGWKVVRDGDQISATNGQHIGVAEIDSSNATVKFSDGTAVISNESTPGLLYGLKFADATGETNNGKTQIILGSPSVPGNKFKYKISESSQAVPRPTYKTKVSDWTDVPSDSLIAVANGKHIGVAEVNGNNEVIQFSDGIAIVGNEQTPPQIPGFALTQTLDDSHNKKIKVSLGTPSSSANKFRYIVSTDDKPIPTPIVNANVSNWTLVKDGDLIVADPSKYIGIAEVDTGSRVVRFNCVIPSLGSAKLADSLSGVSFNDATGAQNNGKTQLSLPNLSNGGYGFKYFVSTNDAAVPTPLSGENLGPWSDAYNGILISAANGKNIGIAEVDSNMYALQFFNGTAQVVNEDRGLEGGVEFKPGTSYQYNGKTQVSLGQPSVAGNKFRYYISPTDGPVSRPAIGSSVANWSPVQDGDYITVIDGKHIGIAEVDPNNKVVAFTDGIAKVENYAPPLVNGLSLIDVTGITNNGKVTVRLGTPSKIGNKYVYKTLTSLSDSKNYKVSDSASAQGFTQSVASGDILTIPYGNYVSVAEIDTTDHFVQVSTVQMNAADEKIEASVQDSQLKMQSGNLTPDPADYFTIKVTKGTLKTGILTAGTDFTVSNLPSGLSLTAVASSDSTVKFTLSGSLSSALTTDTDIKVVLTYSAITESGLGSSVNSAPITLTIKKY